MDSVVKEDRRSVMQRRRPRARGLVAIVSAVLLAGGVAACGSSSKNSGSSGGAASAKTTGGGSGASASDGALTKVSIAYTAPIADQMLPLVTEQAGLFKKNGINANIQFVEASSVLAAMASGQVNFTVVGSPSAEIASVNGTPLQYIGQWENAIDADVVANKSVGDVKSLSGKTTAVSSTGALSDFLVQLLDQKYGISVHEVPLGQLPNQLTAYSKGSVAAMSGVSPWSVAKLQQTVPGTHVLATFANIKGYPGVGLVADQKYLSTSTGGATAVKVLTALQEGLAYYRSHPAQVQQILIKQTELTPSQAKQAYAASTKLMSANLIPSLADQKNVLKALEPSQPKAKGFDATKLLDTSFATKANQAAK